jgi:hypothetical protein
MALLDVLGSAVLHRVTGRLLSSGISAITVLGDSGSQGTRWLRRALRPEVRWESAPGEMLWRAAQRVFTEFSQAGAEAVIVMRLGPYTELEIGHLVRAHLESGGRITAAVDPCGELLGTFAISPARRNDAAFLLRHQLQEFRSTFTHFRFEGYVNRLTAAADLRQLAIDGFCGRAQITPCGMEVKPGVWVGEGARVYRGARLLAPAFIGEAARVHASAVITRCSTLEHHAVVDCGTVVENATLLPYTTIGAGLDVAHSVVGFRRVTHLRRDVEIEINDPKLVGMVSAAPWRALGQAASLATFLPVNFFRGLFADAREVEMPEAVQAPSAALKATDSVPSKTVVSNYR